MTRIKYPKLHDADWLRNQYEDQGKSILTISQEVGCNNITVLQALRKHGIQARPAKRPLVISETDVCLVCKQEKPIDEFVQTSAKSRGYIRTCRVCYRQQSRESRQRNIESSRKIERESRRRQRYSKLGITEDEWQQRNTAQNSLCAICKKPQQVEGRRLVVDHDHATGNIRGLLCTNCNMGLGYLADDPENLKAALLYLNSTS